MCQSSPQLWCAVHPPGPPGLQEWGKTTPEHSHPPVSQVMSKTPSLFCFSPQYSLVNVLFVHVMVKTHTHTHKYILFFLMNSCNVIQLHTDTYLIRGLLHRKLLLWNHKGWQPPLEVTPQAAFELFQFQITKRFSLKDTNAEFSELLVYGLLKCWIWGSSLNLY